MTVAKCNCRTPDEHHAASRPAAKMHNSDDCRRRTVLLARIRRSSMHGSWAMVLGAGTVLGMARQKLLCGRLHSSNGSSQVRTFAMRTARRSSAEEVGAGAAFAPPFCLPAPFCGLGLLLVGSVVLRWQQMALS